MSLNILLKWWFKKELPIWAHGLECEICQMTFISAEAHLKHARRRRTIKEHQGKIPVLRGEPACK